MDLLSIVQNSTTEKILKTLSNDNDTQQAAAQYSEYVAGQRQQPLLAQPPSQHRNEIYHDNNYDAVDRSAYQESNALQKVPVEGKLYQGDTNGDNSAYKDYQQEYRASHPIRKIDIDKSVYQGNPGNEDTPYAAVVREYRNEHEPVSTDKNWVRDKREIEVPFETSIPKGSPNYLEAKARYVQRYLDAKHNNLDLTVIGKKTAHINANLNMIGSYIPNPLMMINTISGLTPGLAGAASDLMNTVAGTMENGVFVQRFPSSPYVLLPGAWTKYASLSNLTRMAKDKTKKAVSGSVVNPSISQNEDMMIGSFAVESDPYDDVNNIHREVPSPRAWMFNNNITVSPVNIFPTQNKEYFLPEKNKDQTEQPRLKNDEGGKYMPSSIESENASKLNLPGKDKNQTEQPRLKDSDGIDYKVRPVAPSPTKFDNKFRIDSANAVSYVPYVRASNYIQENSRLYTPQDMDMEHGADLDATIIFNNRVNAVINRDIQTYNQDTFREWKGDVKDSNLPNFKGYNDIRDFNGRVEKYLDFTVRAAVLPSDLLNKNKKRSIPEFAATRITEKGTIEQDGYLDKYAEIVSMDSISLNYSGSGGIPAGKYGEISTCMNATYPQNIEMTVYETENLDVRQWMYEYMAYLYNFDSYGDFREKVADKTQEEKNQAYLQRMYEIDNVNPSIHRSIFLAFYIITLDLRLQNGNLYERHVYYAVPQIELKLEFEPTTLKRYQISWKIIGRAPNSDASHWAQKGSSLEQSVLDTSEKVEREDSFSTAGNDALRLVPPEANKEASVYQQGIAEWTYEKLLDAGRAWDRVKQKFR